MGEYGESEDNRWREGYIEPPAGGGIPERYRLMLDRFSRGCEVCGDMNWFATASGEMSCGSCGNIFDVPLMDEADTGANPLPTTTEGQER